MKIAMLGPYSQECGIAGYGQTLRAGFEHNGHDVVVLGNYPYMPVYTPDDEKVFRCFHVESRDHMKDFDYDGALNFMQGSNILLIQIEASLYPLPELATFIEKVRYCTNCRIVPVLHSTCVWPNFPWQFVHWGIAHEEGILQCIPSNIRSVIRHGAEDYPDTPVEVNRGTLGMKNAFTFGSFGLGRVRYDQTIPAVTSIGCQYLISSPESQKHWITTILDKLTPEQRSLVYFYPTWETKPGLIRRIQACEAVLIDYPPVGAYVCSGTARIALGARRKIVASQTNWFRDLLDKDFVYSIKPELDGIAMQLELRKVVDDISINGYKIGDSQEQYVKQNSWNNIARDEFIPLFEKLLQ